MTNDEFNLTLDERIALDDCNRGIDFNNPLYDIINDDLLLIYSMLEEQFDNGVICYDAAHDIYEKLAYAAYAWPAVRLFAVEVYRDLETSERGTRLSDIKPFAEVTNY